MAKIKLDDTLMTILLKLTEGNPGAATVLVKIVKEADTIDPDASLGHLAILLDLDTLEIYGSNIWILYKDICNSSIKHFIAVLRANQLGFISSKQLREAILTPDPLNKLLPDSLLTRVQTALPNFAK